MRVGARPEDAAESAADLESVSVALDHLAPRLRAVVVLKDVYGLPHEAIADELAARPVKALLIASAAATDEALGALQRRLAPLPVLGELAKTVLKAQKN